MFEKINESIHKKAASKKSKGFEKDDNDSPENKGKLLVDATCSPADITFLTDLKLLNKARKKSEKTIDILHKPHKGKKLEPRTYCRIARKDFLSVAKAKSLSKNKRRKVIRKQLGYVERDLKTINKLTKENPLSLLTGSSIKICLLSAN